MKMIERLVIVPVTGSSGEFLIVNAITGEVCVLNGEEHAQIQEWIKGKKISSKSDNDNDLINNLQAKLFIVENSIEEENLYQDALTKARNKHIEVKSHFKNIMFVLSYGCNFACPYCYEKDFNPNNDQILTKEQVDKIFKIHENSIESIGLYGGEPLLPEHMDIIKYIIKKSPNSIYNVTTNGYYLLEYLNVFRNLHISTIMVTLDGDKAMHDKTRILKNKMAHGTYTRIMTGIHAYLKDNIPIKIRMNITPSNLDICTQLREQLIVQYSKEFQNGLLLFELQPVFQLESGLKQKLEECVYFGINESSGKIMPPDKRRNVMTRSVSPVLLRFLSSNQNVFLKYNNCDAESHVRFYDPIGDIYSCILSLGNRAATVGRYFPEYELYSQSMLNRNIENIEKCKDCRVALLCGGGCAYGVLKNAHSSVMVPNCAQVLHLLYDQLPNIYQKFLVSGVYK